MKHPYLPKLLFLLLFFCAGFTGAFAQTGSVSGRVVDEKSQGMPGVTVLIEGTSLGNSTNSDGTFSILNVPAGPHTLVTSFVGYTSQRIPVTVVSGQNATVAGITLGENTTLLSEAVVVGYGTQRRQDVTSSITTVSSREFVQGQITTPEQLINGKVAGVQITSNSGQPGSGSTIRIRGGSSLNASNDPLVIIDGVPVDNNELKGAPSALSLVNPNDIETFTVLKDASATAIYGSRASNGVILITTKKGLQGEKTRVNFNTQFSVSKNYKQTEVLSGDQIRAIVNEKGTDDQKALANLFPGTNTNWQDQIYRTANTSDNNLSVTGSAGKLPYRASVGYLTQQGLLKTNDLKRNSVSLGLTPVLLDGNLKVDLNVKGSWVDNNYADQGVVGTATFFDPTKPVFAPGAGYAAYGGYYQPLDLTSTTGGLVGLAPTNPVARLEQRRDRSTIKRSIGNVQLDYKMPFLTDLRANLNLGYDISRSNGTTFVPAIAASEINRKGVNDHYSQSRDNKLLEFYLNYSKQLPNDLGRLDLLAGHSYQDFRRNTPFQQAYQADGQLVSTKSGFDAYSRNVLISFYGRLNYNYKDRYLVTASLRNDASSRFAKSVRNGLFPAVSAAWRVKGEDFLANNTLISDLKFRVSYGVTGQQDIVGNDYPSLANYNPGESTVGYQFGGIYYPTLRISPYDTNIKWEETKTYNAGLDYGILDNRLVGTVDVYLRKTNDLIALITARAGTNFSNQFFTNAGNLENRGLELGLTGQVVRSTDINWTLNANATLNRNKITNLGQESANAGPGNRFEGIDGGTGNNIKVNTAGYPVGSYYVYQQVYENGKPVLDKYVDRNNDGQINEQDLYRYHSAAPKATYGLSSNLSVHKATLAFTLRSYQKNYVYDNVRSNNSYYTNVLQAQPFLGNATPELLNSQFAAPGEKTRLSDYWVHDASFIRMDNITLGYDFGSLIQESTNLHLTFAVQNVFTVTKYKGLDPEIFNGLDKNLYPRPRTFTVGLNFGL
ncbi:SusC/RagA family TonB-linked outer membrane protein [Hymenobacter persicinus]|uniref:SusC/RagA family TonB-linked outer membrane protein n=1 Tax=Hymenobacter persicinus TaxID=2025506 RepID=A0A4Q5LEQ9_9BACT|nr:SusC/RagA family TonB-linked outer membrane protein [Hymenobacter persicinus]RYU82469.1 SusC/RagA family TonB-linked outer membrane protein [Hymenobacter persicinus]